MRWGIDRHLWPLYISRCLRLKRDVHKWEDDLTEINSLNCRCWGSSVLVVSEAMWHGRHNCRLNAALRERFHADNRQRQCRWKRRRRRLLTWRHCRSDNSLALSVRETSDDLYLHTKFHWNQENFLWTDWWTAVPTDGQFRPPLMAPCGLRGRK